MWVNGNRRSDYSTLLLFGVLLLAVSQALEGSTNGVAGFARGAAIGLSIACNLIGLALYARKKG